MIKGCARICSPWKPNSRTSVASSATSDRGCSCFKGRGERPGRRAPSATGADNLRKNDGHDNVKRDREKQRLPWHGNSGEAKKETHDRGEGEDHDEHR